MTDEPFTAPALLIPNEKLDSTRDRPVPQPPPNPNDNNPDPPPHPGGKKPDNPPKDSDLTLMEINWGHKKDTWREYAEDTKRIKPHCISFCEVGDQGIGLRKIMEETGYRLLDGTGLPGQASTVVLWNPRTLDLIEPRNHFIHRPARIKTNGPGTMMMKPKWLIGGHFKMQTTGDMFDYYSAHWVYNMDEGDPNRRIGFEMSRNTIADTKNIRVLVFIGADYNMKPDAPMAAPLRHGGYHSTNNDGPHMAAIMDIKWRASSQGKKFRLKDKKLLPSGSDHPTLVIRGEIHS